MPQYKVWRASISGVAAARVVERAAATATMVVKNCILVVKGSLIDVGVNVESVKDKTWTVGLVASG